MAQQKPTGLTDEDWEQTPASVRRLVMQILEQQSQNSEYVPKGRERPAENSLPVSRDAWPDDSAGGGYLLVVDDNEMNRDMLSRRLSRQGHTVAVAVNGREALERLRADDFDLVLLDIMMPEMNGYEVLERMRVDHSLSYIPVIMITAVDEIESIVRCIELGAEDYLPKPFNPILLKARVNASLEKKRLRDQQQAYLEQLNFENQRKSDELEQARRIQLSMLPTRPPLLPFVEVAARQQTASEVGGDYYDFFVHLNGRLRVAIGDATGHGVASGLMVSMTKASLMGAGETDLVMLIKEINATLTKVNLGPQLNMALLLLELFQKQKGGVTVRASGGGMPPIYILRAQGQTDEALISGLPLGVIEEAVYEHTELDLEPGDVILLASDGLPERFNAARELLGFDRLTAALDGIDPTLLSAAEILDHVAAISDAWAQNYPPHDDMTLLVMKIR